MRTSCRSTGGRGRLHPESCVALVAKRTRPGPAACLHRPVRSFSTSQELLAFAEAASGRSTAPLAREIFGPPGRRRTGHHRRRATERRQSDRRPLTGPSLALEGSNQGRLASLLSDVHVRLPDRRGRPCRRGCAVHLRRRKAGRGGGDAEGHDEVWKLEASVLLERPGSLRVDASCWPGLRDDAGRHRGARRLTECDVPI